MPKTGRNEPCPCGSGKKYKKCCLLSRGASTYYTKAERDTALMSVVAFLRAADELENDLLVEFYEDCPPPIEGSGLKDMSDISFEAWACFDVMISDGRTLSDIAINDHRLSAGERGYLEVMRRSAVRLYEVVEVVPGATLALRDVITDEVQVVQERRGSEQIPRWSLIATRVVPCGSAEPPLVCDGGILPFDGPQCELIEHIHTILDAYRRDCPELPEAEVQLNVFKTLASTFHRLWITPTIPKALVNYDGDPLLFAESFFDLHDPDAATSRLDATDLLDRDDTGWVWLGTGTQRSEPVIYGSIERRGERLVLRTNSQPRAESGRQLLEELLGPTASYRMTSTSDLLEAVKDRMNSPDGLESSPRSELDDLDPVTRSALDDAVEAHLYRHYDAWLDEPVPLLDDRTPREAAASAKLRARLVEQLKQLEIMYTQALRDGEAAFDPSWIWDELGLAEELASTRDRRQPPPLGHERIAALVPGISAVAEQVASRIRKGTQGSLSRTIARRELMDDLSVRRLLSEHDVGEASTPSGEVIAAHLELRANFELHLRKVFWVDEGLSWTLGATRLDIGAESLRLPFGAFALVYTDRYALGLAERALSRDPTCPIRGMLLEVVTIYVSEFDDPGGRGLRLAMTFDPLGKVWPHLIVRDLLLGPDADLDAILKSGFPGEDDELAPLYACTPLRNLVHLALNSILYATSAGARTELRAPAEPAEPRLRERLVHTSESVHFLPGTIDITTLRAIQRARRNAADFEVIHRSMVRGHWRRASAGWSDQRVRWIVPYWRGPSVASVIERQFRLRP